MPTCLTSSTTVLVCAGKDCRSDRGFDELLRMAERCPGSATVGCQGECHGPIVGVQVKGEIRWFSRVRSRSMRAAVRTVADRGRLGRDRTGQRLRGHEIRRRRGVVKGRRRLEPIGR